MRFFALVLSLFFASTCYAELYVVYDKNTKEVITASEQNDTVVQEGQEVKVLQGNLKDFSDENPCNYKLSGTRFVKNLAKIDAEEQQKIQDEERKQEEALIQKEIRDQAIKSLEDKGVTFKHIGAE